MSDVFYTLLRGFGYHVAWLTSSPVILHRERTARPGAYILAANHLSPYDIPCLYYASRRKLDFISIVEIFRKPVVGKLFGAMNAFPLDRSRPDAPTVRIALDRLRRGRVVAMFPEGGIQTMQTSLLTGGRIKPGVARMARLSGAPVIPCVILGTRGYSRFANWLPFKRIRWGVIFGEPLLPRPDLPEREADDALLADLRAAYERLYADLRQAVESRHSTAQIDAAPGDAG